MKSSLSVVFICIGSVSAFNSFFAPPKAQRNVAPPPSKVEINSWLDEKLKYPEPPTFDVLAKTIEFAQCTSYEQVEKFYDDDYVFRGSIIGPINADDVRETQKGFNILDAYPDLETRPFGFTVDPDNPYRCYYFERWEGTHAGAISVGPTEYPPTNDFIKLPTHIMSLNWTPEGKVIYACLSAPLDRFEGKTRGSGAVLGLLIGAGLNLGEASVGNGGLRIAQRLAHLFGGLGRNWSKEADIPSWWKSKARGADPTDL